MTVQDIIGNYEKFLFDIFEDLKRVGVDPVWPIDHLCYRVETLEQYSIKKLEFIQVATLLGEVEIGGRPIATFKLHEPLKYQNKVIPLVELPAPKPSRRDIQGLEHIEFVVPDELLTFVASYPHLNFETHALAKKINPDVSIKLPSGEVKFHRQSLEDVIALENQID